MGGCRLRIRVLSVPSYKNPFNGSDDKDLFELAFLFLAIQISWRTIRTSYNPQMHGVAVDFVLLSRATHSNNLHSFTPSQMYLPASEVGAEYQASQVKRGK
jgi:hypothetical protein